MERKSTKHNRQRIQRIHTTTKEELQMTKTMPLETEAENFLRKCKGYKNNK